MNVHALKRKQLELSNQSRVSWYQKGKANLDLLKQETVSSSGISWAICKSAPHPSQASMPPLSFLQAGCRQPTASKH